MDSLTHGIHELLGSSHHPSYPAELQAAVRKWEAGDGQGAFAQVSDALRTLLAASRRTLRRRKLVITLVTLAMGVAMLVVYAHNPDADNDMWRAQVHAQLAAVVIGAWVVYHVLSLPADGDARTSHATFAAAVLALGKALAALADRWHATTPRTRALRTAVVAWTLVQLAMATYNHSWVQDRIHPTARLLYGPV